MRFTDEEYARARQSNEDREELQDAQEQIATLTAELRNAEAEIAALRADLEVMDRAIRSISRIHFRDANDPNFCSACGTSWPCLTRDALATLAAVRSARTGGAK